MQALFRDDALNILQQVVQPFITPAWNLEQVIPELSTSLLPNYSDI